MKYAVISDIHGNDIALSNVIRDAKKHGVDAWIFAGDYCIDAPWPKEVIETLQSMENAFIVRGNEEKLLHIPEGDFFPDILIGWILFRNLCRLRMHLLLYI